MAKTKNYITVPHALIEDIAANKDVRFYLNQPYLDKRGKKPMLVATNGHMLAAAPVEVHGDVEQGPIPTEAIKRCRKADRTLPPVMYFDGLLCGTGKVMFEREFMDCKFPDWTKLIPKKRKGPSDIAFDARYFKMLQDALAPGTKIGQAGTAVWLQYDGKGKVDSKAAFRVDCKDDEAIGVLMPMRWD